MQEIQEIDDLKDVLMAAPAPRFDDKLGSSAPIGAGLPQAPRRGRPPKTAATEATTEVVILRDWWNEAGERNRVGSVVTVPVSMALYLVEEGLARGKR